MMKVFAVTTWPPHMDGIAYYSKHLYEELSGLAEVKILANTSNNKPNIHEKVKVENIWRRGQFNILFKVFNLVKREKPDIIHVQHGWLLYGSYLASCMFVLSLGLLRIRNVPLVTTIHSVVKKDVKIVENPIKNAIGKIIITFLTLLIVKFSDRVIVHAELIKEYLVKYYKIKDHQGKIVVIHHGTRRLKKRFEKNFKKTYYLIFSFGFIRKTRGIEELISAFKNFLKQHPNSYLIITGGKHAHSRTLEGRSFTGVDKLGNKIQFTGFLPEKRIEEIVELSDLIVLSSKDDRSLEASGTFAMVADQGKPIICSKVSKFLIDPDARKSCIFYEKDNVEQLTEIFEKMFDAPEIRRKIGKALQQYTKDKYWDITAKKHIQVFSSLL
jgi:glycosyltransferase involved in cell wall biosynthesis